MTNIAYFNAIIFSYDLIFALWFKNEDFCIVIRG